MDILKSTGSVLAGFITVLVLSMATDAILQNTGVFPKVMQPGSQTTWMLGLALFYRTVFTIAGGWIAAKLAPDRPMFHVMVLGSLGMAMATLGAAAHWDKAVATGRWYPIALIALSLPSVWLGGKLRLGKNSEAKPK